MESYKSRSSQTSGVIAFEKGEDYLLVKFQNGSLYNYPEILNNKTVIDHMKQLATNQSGLTTYINQHKPRFA